MSAYPKLYPYDLPPGMHPLGWTLLGFGLSADQIQRIITHQVDRLGMRLVEAEQVEHTYSWAVDWALDPGDRTPVTVGETVDLLVPDGDRTAVRVTGGALPPGVRLEKHSGRLVGAFARPGLYSVTVTTGPAVKWDPLGTPGGPEDVGEWKDINTPRFVPPAAPQPTARLDELDPQELEALIVAAQEAQRVQLIRESDGGGA